MAAGARSLPCSGDQGAAVSIAPGWYRDPADPTTQRFWDGEGWIGAPLPADATPPPGPPTEPAAPPAAPWGGQSGPAAAPDVARPAPVPPASLAQVRLAPRTPGPPPRPYGYTLATLGARLVARLIDIGILLLLNVLVNGWFVAEWVREVWPVFREALQAAAAGTPVSEVATTSDRSDSLLTIIVIIIAALWFAYEVPAVANTGQTPGKRLLGIKVVRLDPPAQPATGSRAEQPIGVGRSFRRWNPMGLPVLLWLCGIGFLLQLVDALSPVFDRPMQQALHDKYARTAVISVHPRPPVPEEQSDVPADPFRS